MVMGSRFLFAAGVALEVSPVFETTLVPGIYGADTFERYIKRLSQPTLNQPRYDPDVENRIRKLGLESQRNWRAWNIFVSRAWRNGRRSVQPQ